MDFEQRLIILKQIDLFQSLTDEELTFFAKAISPINLKDETVLFHEGDVSQDMYILVSGSLQIFKKNRRLTTIYPPDYVGEMSLIDDQPRSATVIAASGSMLFKITVEQFETFAERPKTLIAILKTLSRRIRQDNELISAEFSRANILIHDMRNTISAFLMLDLLEKTDIDDKQRKYLSILQKGRHDLAEMLEEALANAKRLDFDKKAGSYSLLNLIKELADGDFSVHPDISNKDIVLDLSENLPEFFFNRTDIRRVITNLVINAAQACRPKDSISISLSKKDDLAEVTVSDPGCGIQENIKNKIFLPNFSNKKGGSGFGLASCKQIIEEQHGGTLSFTSDLDNGSTFTFTLPIK